MSFVLNYSVLQKMVITAELIVKDISGMLVPNIDYSIGTMKNEAGKAHSTDKIIVLSEVVLNLLGEKQAMNTLIHEIFHVIAPNSGHKGNWKRLADRFNSSQYSTEYGNITRSVVQNDILREERIKNAKYIIECTACGERIHRQQLSKLIKYPEKFQHKCKDKGVFKRIK